MTPAESSVYIAAEISWNLLAQIIFHPTNILAVDFARRYPSHDILITTGHFNKYLLIPFLKVVFSENGDSNAFTMLQMIPNLNPYQN